MRFFYFFLVAVPFYCCAAPVTQEGPKLTSDEEMFLREAITHAHLENARQLLPHVQHNHDLLNLVIRHVLDSEIYTLLQSAGADSKVSLPKEYEILSRRIRVWARKVIPNASYVVIQGDTSITTERRSSKIPESSRYAKFYTYDGKLLRTIPHDRDFQAIKNMADPFAPKPQAIFYRITYWPGICIKRPSLRRGYFIIFYDRHRNKITSYRFYKNTQEIEVFDGKFKLFRLADLYSLRDFPLDVSKLMKKLSFNSE